jgi:hypothetical protein
VPAEEALETEVRASADIDKYYEWTRQRRARVLARWADAERDREKPPPTEPSSSDAASATSGVARDVSITAPASSVTKSDPANIEAEMKSLTATAAKNGKGKDGVTTPERKEAVSASLDAALKDASLRAERARHSVEALEALAPPKFASRRDREEEK